MRRELSKLMFLTSLMTLSVRNMLRHASVAQLDAPVRLETRRSRVQPPPRSATFFRGD